MFSTEDHWRFFPEFCKWELASGGPDPQLAMIAGMSKGVSDEELLWRAGCYISVYNVPYAEAIWREWPWKRVLAKRNQLEPWLRKNWSKITTRIERRCIRKPEWLAQFLLDYSIHAKMLPQLRKECKSKLRPDAYEFMWEENLQVKNLGRYVNIKLLEFLRRYADFSIATPDIRPKGGWSPRTTLSLLWEDPSIQEANNKPELLERINKRCWDTINRLSKDHKVIIDLFQLQVMLCEYRESFEGQKQYPGRSLDSELKYARKAETEWGIKSEIWKARKALFPKQHLGELHGWEGPRERPAHCLTDCGYTWSDLLYDFSATTDFAEPKTRPNVPQPLIVSHSDSPAVVGKTIPKIYPILEGKLYQSARWTLMTPDEGRALAEQHGITGIANFWKHDSKLPDMVSWYNHWPMADGQHIPTFALQIIVKRLLSYMESGGVVLSMCWGGRNRSGLVSALLVRELTKCSGEQAVGIIQKQRPGSLINLHFVNYLHSLGSKK